MVHKDPAGYMARLQGRYAAIELIREEIKRLEAIVRAEDDIIRGDVERDLGLDLSQHMIAVARGMFDLDAHRETGAAEALAIIGSDGLFAAAGILSEPQPTSPSVDDPKSVPATGPEKPVVQPDVRSKQAEPAPQPKGQMLFGVAIKPENSEDARIIVAAAQADAAKGVEKDKYKNSRGKYIWRSQLYRAAFAAASRSPTVKVPDRQPEAPEQQVAQPPATPVEPDQRSALGMRLRRPNPTAVPQPVTEPETDDRHSEPPSPQSDMLFGEPDDDPVGGHDVVTEVGGDDDLDEVPPFLMTGPECHGPDDDPGGGSEDEYGDGEGRNFAAEEQSVTVRYREDIASNDLFDQAGRQPDDAPPMRGFGFGSKAFGLHRGLGNRRTTS